MVATSTTTTVIWKKHNVLISCSFKKKTQPNQKAELKLNTVTALASVLENLSFPEVMIIIKMQNNLFPLTTIKLLSTHKRSYITY